MTMTLTVKNEENAVPKGYKLTEVGVIPEDWDVKTLSQCATITSGGTPSTSNKDYWDGCVNWCTPTDITALNGQKYLSNTSRKITKLGVIKSSAEILPVGTVVMTSRATIGECAISTVEITTNQGFKNFVCNAESNNEFLFYLLGSSKDRFVSLCSGSTFLEISTMQVRNFKVAIPNISEQTSIANTLSDVDALINELEKLIAKKQAIKTATMQQLLTGRTRLPQFALREDGSKKGYKSSELGDVPEDWDVKTLSQCATITSGGTPSTSNKDYWDGCVNWCTPTDITALNGQKYLSNTSRKITKLGVIKSSAEILPVGTVVMTSRATIGECAISTVEITTNQGFKNFVCNAESNNEFLFYLLGSSKDRFVSLCSGSTFLEISTMQVRNFKVAIPNISEQTAIATILSDMDEDIQALEQRLNKTRQIKQGMMQELLTGKTRLPINQDNL